MEQVIDLLTKIFDKLCDIQEVLVDFDGAFLEEILDDEEDADFGKCCAEAKVEN